MPYLKEGHLPVKVYDALITVKVATDGDRIGKRLRFVPFAWGVVALVLIVVVLNASESASEALRTAMVLSITACLLVSPAVFAFFLHMAHKVETSLPELRHVRDVFADPRSILVIELTEESLRLKECADAILMCAREEGEESFLVRRQSEIFHEELEAFNDRAQYVTALMHAGQIGTWPPDRALPPFNPPH